MNFKEANFTEILSFKCVLDSAEKMVKRSLSFEKSVENKIINDSENTHAPIRINIATIL